ncbi:MAG: helix-turn-helix transcriptional regulator [Patescibacteria group bacterium UBA2163]
MRQGIKNSVYTYREKSRYTQVALADAVGVTRQTIIALEKGNYTPSVALALKLASVFDCCVEDLFTLL